MAKKIKNSKPSNVGLAKSATGIQGLDEITGGGLPRGRPTLVAGNAGCGKTLLAMEFLRFSTTSLAFLWHLRRPQKN